MGHVFYQATICQSMNAMNIFSSASRRNHGYFYYATHLFRDISLYNLLQFAREVVGYASNSLEIMHISIDCITQVWKSMLPLRIQISTRTCWRIWTLTTTYNPPAGEYVISPLLYSPVARSMASSATTLHKMSYEKAETL
jgi:hypothetical protein